MEQPSFHGLIHLELVIPSTVFGAILRSWSVRSSVAKKLSGLMVFPNSILVLISAPFFRSIQYLLLFAIPEIEMKLLLDQLERTGFLEWALGVLCIGKWVLWLHLQVQRMKHGIFSPGLCPATEMLCCGVIRLKYSIRMYQSVLIRSLNFLP